jgi:hypothetical protein
MIRLCLSIIAAAAVVPAYASCGATSCTLLTDRFALANWDHVGWTIDSRIEFVTQDRLQSGTQRVGSDAVEEGEPIERRTRNTASYRGRDAGAQSEPDASGATTLAVSPGASVAIGERSAISAFVQLPLYQRVNGVQLVPRFGFSLGVNHAF